jgi:hypothetical protein
MKKIESQKWAFRILFIIEFRLNAELVLVKMMMNFKGETRSLIKEKIYL